MATTKKTAAKKKTAKTTTKAETKPTAKKTAKKAAAETKPAAKKKTAQKSTTETKPAAKKKTAQKSTTETKPAATKSSPPSDVAALLRVRDQLRAYAFAMPAAWEDHPWGESVAKVGKKVFVFFGTADPAQLHKGIGMSVKLPRSGDLVLALPFAEPTGYGLGKAGWVSVYLQPAEMPPLPMLTSWIDESYRAVAPKKQVAELDARGSGSR